MRRTSQTQSTERLHQRIRKRRQVQTLFLVLALPFISLNT